MELASEVRQVGTIGSRSTAEDGSGTLVVALCALAVDRERHAATAIVVPALSTA